MPWYRVYVAGGHVDFQAKDIKAAREELKKIVAGANGYVSRLVRIRTVVDSISRKKR